MPSLRPPIERQPHIKTDIMVGNKGSAPLTSPCRDDVILFHQLPILGEIMQKRTADKFRRSARDMIPPSFLDQPTMSKTHRDLDRDTVSIERT